MQSGSNRPSWQNFFPRAHNFKVIRGIHSSKEDGYLGDEVDLITLEFNGNIYHRVFTPDTPIEPWMFEVLIEKMGASLHNGMYSYPGDRRPPHLVSPAEGRDSAELS
jgi:hypothetical protein